MTTIDKKTVLALCMASTFALRDPKMNQICEELYDDVAARGFQDSDTNETVSKTILSNYHLDIQEEVYTPFKNCLEFFNLPADANPILPMA